MRGLRFRAAVAAAATLASLAAAQGALAGNHVSAVQVPAGARGAVTSRVAADGVEEWATASTDCALAAASEGGNTFKKAGGNGAE